MSLIVVKEVVQVLIQLLAGNSPPPQDHDRALGIVLLYGPRGVLFLMSKVPLFHPSNPP